jgi:hypothetical protein
MGYFVRKVKGTTQNKTVKLTTEAKINIDMEKKESIVEETVVVPERIHIKRGVTVSPEPNIKKGSVIEKVFEKKELKKGQQAGRNLTELHKVIYDKKNLNIDGITSLSKHVDNQLSINNVNRSFIDLLNFKNFIKDKNIILVANSSDLLKNKNGSLIDSYDIVIRFNSFKIDEEYTGKKTTIHASVYLQDINLDQFVPIRFIVSISLKKWINKIQSLDKFKQSFLLKYNHHNELKDQKTTGAPPTTGFVMLTLLLKLGGFKKLDLIGFNFYDSGISSILRTDEGLALDISTVHNYDLEKEIIMKTASGYDKENNIITFYDNSTI